MTVSLSAITGQQALAGTLHQGWNYGIDSFNDGVSGEQVGGGVFEFYGMAFKEETDNLIVAFNANLPLEGYVYPGVENGSISWGDLFFNFSGENFETASAKGDLFGIRFAQSNDSGVVSLGVYSQVIAKSVTQVNAGFDSLQIYNYEVEFQKGTPSQGDLLANDSYFAQEKVEFPLNEIGIGTKIGEITWLSQDELQLAGLDFNYFGTSGSQTFGFSLSKSLLPKGNYVANVFAECLNDGVALKGKISENTKSVPESSPTLSLIAFGAIGAGLQLKRKGLLKNKPN